MTVRTLAAADGAVLAAGAGGALYSRQGDDWRRERWDGSKSINGVVAGEVPVAVGADGLLLERAPADGSTGSSAEASGQTDT
ncbi:hypothetical protein ACFQL4_10160 [Halosimplex aquaticum]